MNYHEQLPQFAIGCAGAAIAEILHWHRIARRGKWPRYGRSAVYWLVTLLLVTCGGVIAALVSPSGSAPLQLLIIGIAGPQLLELAVQSRVRNARKDGEVHLGSDSTGIADFLGS